ncbi:unnamed protein product [Brassica napus]|uniref:(rape) hypothetical protein n=1 Tax=Brassica napus TaxID=3708 RepID=A0A816JDJ0_BRANA|nr:unnamed protein product [Brassica napus]
MLRALVRPLEWWCLGSRGSGHGGPEASKFVAATLSTDHNVAVEEVRKEVKVIFDAYLKRGAKTQLKGQ